MTVCFLSIILAKDLEHMNVEDGRLRFFLGCVLCAHLFRLYRRERVGFVLPGFLLLLPKSKVISKRLSNGNSKGVMMVYESV